MKRKLIALVSLPFVIGALAGCNKTRSYAVDNLDIDQTAVVRDPITGEERTSLANNILENTLAFVNGVKGEGYTFQDDKDFFIKGHFDINGKIYNNNSMVLKQAGLDFKTRKNAKVDYTFNSYYLASDDSYFCGDEISGKWHGEVFSLGELNERSAWERDDLSDEFLDISDIDYTLRSLADIGRSKTGYIAIYNNYSEDKSHYIDNDGNNVEYRVRFETQRILTIEDYNGKEVITHLTSVERELTSLDRNTGRTLAGPTLLIGESKQDLSFIYDKDFGDLAKKDIDSIKERLSVVTLESYVRGRHYFVDEQGKINSDYDHSSYFEFTNRISDNKLKVFGIFELNTNYGQDEYLKMTAQASLPHVSDTACVFSNSLSDVLKKLPKGLEYVTVDGEEYIHVKNAEFEYGKQIFVVAVIEKDGDNYDFHYEKAVIEDYDPFSFGH